MRTTSSVRAKASPAIQKLQRLGGRPFKRDSIMRQFTSFLWKHRPLQAADDHQHTVWLFDNTAFQRTPSRSHSGHTHSWYAEVVAVVFEKDSRHDMSALVAMIADLIGLDGEYGTERDIRHRIAERLQPFLWQTVPGQLMMLELPLPNHTTLIHQLGPTDHHGLSNQVINTGSRHITDGTTVHSYLRDWSKDVSMETVFAGPHGWLVLSDIDDTIKYTKTSESTGILRTTFVDEPRPIAGMPLLYGRIQQALQQPVWFYLSASPYNLYPFLRRFIHSHFTPGTLLLRESSWFDVSELVKSFTVNTMEYKVERIKKIRHWFPHRRVLCIGDSTQKDPEAYAEIYKRHPDWIQAIWIRKVTDVPYMEARNAPERFENAFKDVPRRVWRVFEQPHEMDQQVDHIAAY
ncbi:hypothetical protein FE257_001145 [Aspergillus nanangensis]|uniref:Phosphatidate phosphatase APP1 catalytic domain-containing protein n=1 Tax=Aspergillus nanangensis TaxID=2582783 RepID=A0AAD4CVV2_ASPNN|nr:hypothetical protein FE257_001145 [Aspergillus nanangensis]